MSNGKIWAVVSRRDDEGRFAEVGMNNRLVVSDLSSIVGIHMRAQAFAAHGQDYRIEFFYPENKYGKPFRVDYRGSREEVNADEKIS